MTRIPRYGRMTAKEGRGDELAELMLSAAEEQRKDPGCVLYLLNRQADDPDTFWITELWADQAALDASIERITGSDAVAAVRELVADGGMIELEQLGGKGPEDATDAEEAFTLKQVADVTDMAAQMGFEETGEARFLNPDLGTVQTGVSHHKLKPGMRQRFGHRHVGAEEVYLVIAGSGRVKLDDEVVELTALDALRVSPQVMRNFEAGDDGLELVAFGPRHDGDVELAPGWWTD